MTSYVLWLDLLIDNGVSDNFSGSSSIMKSQQLLLLSSVPVLLVIHVVSQLGLAQAWISPPICSSSSFLGHWRSCVPNTVPLSSHWFERQRRHQKKCSTAYGSTFQALTRRTIDSRLLGVVFASTSDNGNEDEDKPKRKKNQSAIQVDYEYVPGEDANVRNTLSLDENLNFKGLSSSYPADTPPGLRGEAVRSALRSGNCIGWATTDNEGETDNTFFGGVVELRGPGCVDFLNNQLSQTFEEATSADSSVGCFQEAALLTSKGRMIDQLGVVIVPPQEEKQQQAFLFTSPGGHAPGLLTERLDRYIFPMDRVAVQTPSTQFHFSLASYDTSHVQAIFDREVVPRLSTIKNQHNNIQLPSSNQCLVLHLDKNNNIDLSDTSSSCLLLILPTASLPECATVGYTFVFVSTNDKDASITRLGQSLWSYLISEQCPNGPVALGPLEWESLRIEAGQPRYGWEYTGHVNTKQQAPKTLAQKRFEKETSAVEAADSLASSTLTNTPAIATPASPLELYQSSLVSLDKGCYMGQEGVASILKNPKGPPRTLYQVVFDDDVNVYDYQTRSDKQAPSSFLENQTHLPQPGDTLCVLGSSESIVVGTVTSVAEPGSTGDFRQILGLALIKRAPAILSQMQALDLSLPDPSDEMMALGEGILLPPPKDPLHGLEVIVRGSFAVGKLQSIPSRRGWNEKSNMFVLTDQERAAAEAADTYGEEAYPGESTVDVTRVPLSTTLDSFRTRGTNPIPTSTLDESINEGEQDPWDTYVQDGKDEAGKSTMHEIPALVEPESLLQNDQEEDENTEAEQEEDEALAEELKRAEEEAKAAAAEAQRKADKMAMLKKRAEQALAARKKKKEEQNQQEKD